MPTGCTSVKTIVRLPKFSLSHLVCLVAWLVISASAIVARADYPLVSHRYAADPAALEFNGRLYLYCSNDDENGTNGYLMSSITCFSTDDLKNWTDHGVVFRASATSWASLAWAPSAVSNQSKVYLYFANGAGSIGVATSSVPTGPFTDARGSALITGSTPGASTATQWLFDPCAFMDSDGQSYLYFGGQYPTNARVILLNPNLVSVSGSASPMFATNFFEASSMHKRGGIYYFTYCNRFEFGAAIYCETNSNPTNGFVPQGTVLANPPQNVNNNNHHSIVSYLGNWYIAYHNRAAALQRGLSNAEAVYKRSLCLDALNYNADGSIQQVTPTTNGLTQLKYLNPYNRTEAETIAAQSGIYTEPCNEGGLNVTNIFNGNWTMVRGVDFTSAGATNFTARIANAGPGGNIELRLDGTNGTLIGTCTVPATGGWQSWSGVSCAVTNATAKGVHNLYLRFTGAGATNLFNFNWWQFNSDTNSAPPSANAVKFEAESGALGSEFAISNGTPAYITITTDGAGNNPGSAARVATYTVTFPGAGIYKLYARVRVGPGTFNDDSLFYGNGFGIKNPTLNADWIFVNGLGAAGFTAATDTVAGTGTVGSGVWKWVNLSDFAPGPTFSVTSDNLTQIFQIGARENGLDLDAFVFGLSGVSYTVSNLDALVAAPADSANTSTVNWNDLRQRIDGFGGGVQFLSPGSLDPVPNSVMDTLFLRTNANQLGLTILRIGIDPVSWNNNQLLDAQKAVARGAGILATPWTPPAAMKDNTNRISGSLLPAQYTNYANYLNNFAGYMASNNASLKAISVQNEPDYDASYDSCLWTPAQFQTFFQGAAGLITNAPVMMPESLRSDFAYSDPTLNDSVAVTNVDLIGGHLYGDPVIQDYANAHSKGKPTWMTEFLLNDQTIESAIVTARQMHDCLTVANMSAYIWWKTYGDANGLVNASGVPQKRGFIFAQWSRFVRPNDYRIGIANTGTGFVSAYKNTSSGQFAIVAINTSSNATISQTFILTNFTAVSVTPWMTSPTNSLAVQSPLTVTNATFTYTLPPLSVVTFVGQQYTNTPPAFATVSGKTVNPGITLMITNTVTDPDLPTQALTFTLLTAPTNATLTPLNASNALFTWRPLISQADSTNLIQVKVTDNGTPALSATNNFIITVNPASQPALSSIAVGSQVSLSATGIIGPDYSLFTSTDLLNWQLLFTTNPAVMPVMFTDTNHSDAARFYRLQLGP